MPVSHSATSWFPYNVCRCAFLDYSQQACSLNSACVSPEQHIALPPSLTNACMSELKQASIGSDGSIGDDSSCDEKIGRGCHPWKGQVITTYHHDGSARWFSELATSEALSRLSLPHRQSWPIFTGQQGMVMTRDKPVLAIVLETPHDGLSGVPAGFELWIKLSEVDHCGEKEWDEALHGPKLMITRLQQVIPASVGTLREASDMKRTVLKDIPLRADPDGSGHCFLGAIDSPGCVRGWIVTIAATFPKQCTLTQVGWSAASEHSFPSWAHILACPPDTFRLAETEAATVQKETNSS